MVDVVRNIARREAEQYFEDHREWVRAQLNVQQLRLAMMDACKQAIDRLFTDLP